MTMTYVVSECIKILKDIVDVLCGGRDEVDHVYDGERAGSNDGVLWKGRLPPSLSATLPNRELITMDAIRAAEFYRREERGREGEGKAVSLRPAD